MNSLVRSEGYCDSVDCTILNFVISDGSVFRTNTVQKVSQIQFTSGSVRLSCV